MPASFHPTHPPDPTPPTADRQLVLKYHPDKQTVSGGEVPNTEHAFACIKIGGLA